MQIRKAQFQRFTLLLVLAFLLLPSFSYAGDHDKRISGEGTFKDRKGPNPPPGNPSDPGPGPILKSVVLRNPGSLDGPGEPICDVMFGPVGPGSTNDLGVCEVDLEKLASKVGKPVDELSCGDAIGQYVFASGPYDVICFTDIEIDFTGLFSGPAILHDTFAVYGEGVVAGTPDGHSGGYFNGPAVCYCTITDPRNGRVLGTGRVDFFPNEGNFGGDFVGSGGFKINMAYGDLKGLTGSGTFQGTIGQVGTYKAVLFFPKD
jgi:hypothetical protein